MAARRKKISKALERCVRELKDSDELVEHVGNIAARYRDEHALDAGPRATATRHALRKFRKHAHVIAQWLDEALKERPSSAASDALNRISEAMEGSAASGRAASKPVAEWLNHASLAADRSLDAMRKTTRQRNAPRIASEALRATLEHHQIKIAGAGTSAKPSPAVRLLCAVAKSAGDDALTVAEARAVWIASSGRGK